MEELVFGRRYRVTEKIGSGGMAEVYKAVDEVLGRTVAIKVLHSHYANDPGFVARFRQEAQAAANLSHPGIVNIYDWGKDDETYYIVMEFVHGTDLKTIIQQKGAVSSPKAAEYGAQVCAALSVAHGYDIIHRDIKPHNIVLTPDGTVKVMDFGIARAGNTTMTQTGSVLGTAHYVSPEQAQGRPLGPASDLYSLGVVLYELTTGRLPFDADTPVAVALKQVNEHAVPPRQINPEIAPSMEAVILRAMHKETSERYTSAEEMRRDLQRVSSGRMVESPGPGETTVMPAVDGRNGRRDDRPRSSRVRSVPAQRNPWPWVALAAILVVVLAIAGYTFGWMGGGDDTGIVVPDLTGLNLENATDALDAVELTLGVTESRFSEETSGTIISQTPEAGESVEAGTSIDVVISKGIELFVIPDFTGMAENDAIRALRAEGFEFEETVREFNSEVEEGLVISHTPGPGEEFPSGTPITLTVSKGTELKRVPDVVGATQAEADAALKAEGFAVEVIEEYNDSVETGKVISQSPQPGVSVDIGSTVKITISKGVETIEVPRVIDMTENEAIEALEEAGLTVLVNYQISPDDGIVITQSPVPGASAKRGDTVTIWVGDAPDP